MLPQHGPNQAGLQAEIQAQAEPPDSQEPLSSAGIVCTQEVSRFSKWQEDDEQFLRKFAEWQKYFPWFNELFCPVYGMYIV